MKKRLHIIYNAPVTLTMVLICFFVTLLGQLTGGRSTLLLFSTYHSSLLNPLTYLRFFFHIFGHADWSHFIGNVSYLLLLGPILEEKHGSKILLEVIAVTAVMTAIIHYIFFPQVVLCGASGVVFAMILMVSFTKFHEGEIPLSFILVAVLFLGQQIYQGIFVEDNIANTAHIIGGIVGSLTGYLLNKKKR